MAETHFKYFLELPLFNRVSQRFIDFITELGNPVSTEVQVHYWRKKLFFISGDFSQGNQKKALLTPFTSKFSEEEITEFEKLISKFASKFNCSMSLLPQGAVDVKIEIIHPLEAYLGKPIVAKLRVTIISKSLASDLALLNFFAIINN